MAHRPRHLVSMLFPGVSDLDHADAATQTHLGLSVVERSIYAIFCYTPQMNSLLALGLECTTRMLCNEKA